MSKSYSAAKPARKLTFKIANKIKSAPLQAATCFSLVSRTMVSVENIFMINLDSVFSAYLLMTKPHKYVTRRKFLEIRLR